MVDDEPGKYDLEMAEAHGFHMNYECKCGEVFDVEEEYFQLRVWFHPPSCDSCGEEVDI